MKISKSFLLLALALNISGCASLYTTFGSNEYSYESKVYSGTKLDAFALFWVPACALGGGGHGCPVDNPAGLLLWPVVLVDLPLTFVCDSVLLPYTLSQNTNPVVQEQPELQQKRPIQKAPEKLDIPKEKSLKDVPPNWKPVEGDTLSLLFQKAPNNSLQPTGCAGG